MDRIQELRKERKITQVQIAKATGYSQPTVAEWERGTQRPTSDAIVALALFFDVSADYLLGLETEDGTRNTVVSNSFNNNSGNINFKG